MHACTYNSNIVGNIVLYCYYVHIMTAVSVGYPCMYYQNIVLAIISYTHDAHATTISNVEANHTIIFLVTFFTL